MSINPEQLDKQNSDQVQNNNQDQDNDQNEETKDLNEMSDDLSMQDSSMQNYSLLGANFNYIPWPENDYFSSQASQGLQGPQSFQYQQGFLGPQDFSQISSTPYPMTNNYSFQQNTPMIQNEFFNFNLNSISNAHPNNGYNSGANLDNANSQSNSNSVSNSKSESHSNSSSNGIQKNKQIEKKILGDNKKIIDDNIDPKELNGAKEDDLPHPDSTYFREVVTNEIIKQILAYQCKEKHLIFTGLIRRTTEKEDEQLVLALQHNTLINSIIFRIGTDFIVDRPRIVSKVFPALAKILPVSKHIKTFVCGLHVLCDPHTKVNFLKQFSKYTHLTRLHIAANNECLMALAPAMANHPLRQLKLSLEKDDNHIPGFRNLINALEKNNQLVEFSLKNSFICNEDIENLYTLLLINKTIQKLNMCDTDLTCDQMEKLLKAMPYNIGIRELDLRRRTVTKKYVGPHRRPQRERPNHPLNSRVLSTLSTMLETNRTLQTLDLSGQEIAINDDDQGELYNPLCLKEGLAKNIGLTKLNISFARIRSEQLETIVDGLLQNNSIKVLILQNQPDPNDYQHLRFITLNTYDRMLDRLNNVLYRFILGLEKFETLRILDLSNNVIKSACIAELGKFLASPTCRIAYLNLSRSLSRDSSNDEITEKLNYILDGLKSNRSLTKLDLSFNHFKVKELELLTQFLTEQQNLHYLTSLSIDLSVPDNDVENESFTKSLHSYMNAIKADHSLRSIKIGCPRKLKGEFAQKFQELVNIGQIAEIVDIDAYNFPKKINAEIKACLHDNAVNDHRALAFCMGLDFQLGKNSCLYKFTQMKLYSKNVSRFILDFAGCHLSKNPRVERRNKEAEASKGRTRRSGNKQDPNKANKKAKTNQPPIVSFSGSNSQHSGGMGLSTRWGSKPKINFVIAPSKKNK